MEGGARNKFEDVVMQMADQNHLAPAQKDLLQQHLRQFFSDYRTPSHPPYAACPCLPLKSGSVLEGLRWCLEFRGGIFRGIGVERLRLWLPRMIHGAIVELNEKGGSSEVSISDYIKKKYADLPWAHFTMLKHHLAKLCDSGELFLTPRRGYLVAGAKANLGMKSRNRFKGKRLKKKRRLSRGCKKDERRKVTVQTEANEQLYKVICKEVDEWKNQVVEDLPEMENGRVKGKSQQQTHEIEIGVEQGQSQQHMENPPSPEVHPGFEVCLGQGQPQVCMENQPEESSPEKPPGFDLTTVEEIFESLKQLELKPGSDTTNEEIEEEAPELVNSPPQGHVIFEDMMPIQDPQLQLEVRNPERPPELKQTPEKVATKVTQHRRKLRSWQKWNSSQPNTPTNSVEAPLPSQNQEPVEELKLPGSAEPLEQPEFQSQGRPREEKSDTVLCPRCNSAETKYLRYDKRMNLPRNFCGNCERSWTVGGRTYKKERSWTVGGRTYKKYKGKVPMAGKHTVVPALASELRAEKQRPKLRRRQEQDTAQLSTMTEYLEAPLVSQLLDPHQGRGLSSSRRRLRTREPKPDTNVVESTWPINHNQPEEQQQKVTKQRRPRDCGRPRKLE
ncbi:hypothetical protein RJ639_002942 [Escallonia herrerae]|uniref:H15 domain-containing protein n=1 Tax=Escallonia herrerae TaxID=1293975 RepID=A0AA88W565_9ASTE|nr:hypothetical protein RJ639_002942 [Escallonia herrerae]